MSRDEWRFHKLLDCVEELRYHVECIEDGDFDTEMDDITLSAVKAGLRALSLDINRLLKSDT